MDMLHTTEVMAIFVIFWPILAKHLVAMATPLDPCNQKCLLRIGRPRKPPVISNHILAISRRNAFIAIIVPLSLVSDSVTDEFTDSSHKPYLKTKLCMDMSYTIEVMAFL